MIQQSKIKQHTILVVDDIESIRFAISDYLKNDFTTHTAKNGNEALDILKKENIDLVITDIKMPEKDGLELIEIIQKEYTKTKYVLMTAYSTDDYISYARRLKIWNIIPKTTLLDLRYVKIMATKILTGEIFGIDKYFPSSEKKTISTAELMLLQKNSLIFKNDTLYTIELTAIQNKESLCETIGDILVSNGAASIIFQVIEELLSNAALHTGQNQPASQNKTSSEDKTFKIEFGVLENNSAISITDSAGSLTRDNILASLERHVTPGNNGLPIGVNDLHGRGLFISREYLDHLIFNLEPNRRTEVIGILSHKRDQKYRAVSIYQRE